MPVRLALPSTRLTVPLAPAFAMCPAVLSAGGTPVPPAHPMYAYAFELAQRQVAAERAFRAHLASLN